ncbi:MAG: hypothetical protein A3F40_02565 [Chlamydiae bacterium RIFCSPHIGHO2_12_FULL_27_8]|nr:MAG: hypothetical protein A3F40_02565 [Chlamydiae bacterium RIFCSPHIGHO2_12_FULL_27_8]
MQTVLMFISATIFGFFSAKIAKSKNRESFFWFNIGFFFGIVGLLIILFLKAKKSKLLIDKKNILTLLEIAKDQNYWYYLDTNMKQIGPMSLKALFDKFKIGSISESGYVWNDTLEDWTYLKNIPIFKDYILPASLKDTGDHTT